MQNRKHWMNKQHYTEFLVYHRKGEENAQLLCTISLNNLEMSAFKSVCIDDGTENFHYMKLNEACLKHSSFQ